MSILDEMIPKDTRLTKDEIEDIKNYVEDVPFENLTNMAKAKLYRTIYVLYEDNKRLENKLDRIIKHKTKLSTKLHIYKEIGEGETLDTLENDLLNLLDENGYAHQVYQTVEENI